MDANKKNIFLNVLEEVLKIKGFNTNGDFIAVKQDEICENIQNDYVAQLTKAGIKNASTNEFRENNYDVIFNYISNYVFNLTKEVNKKAGFQLSIEQLKEFLMNVSEYDTLDEQLEHVSI